MKRLKVVAIATVVAIAVTGANVKAATLETSFLGTNEMVGVVNVPVADVAVRAGLGMTIPEDSNLEFNYNALVGVGFKGFALDLDLYKSAIKDSDMQMDLSISYRLFKEIADGVSLGVGVNLLSMGLTDQTNEDIQLFRNVSPVVSVELPF